jgi:low temperature requirement protein LtrA
MPRSHQLVWQTTAAHRVTTIELFFDLVFVFAITQVTALMADDLGWRGAFRGLVVLALLWWAWCSYAWLGNQAQADEGVVRAAMILAMAIMFLVALCIPEAWNDRAGGLNASLVLASGVAAVRFTHLAVFAVVGAGDAALRRQLRRTALPVGAAGVLLVAGAWVGGTTQTVLWALALVVDYVGVYVAGTDWHLPAPAHFAERHGLIIIIALGESLIAVGVGMAGNPMTVALLAGALLGVAVSVSLWWSYFDVVGPVAERVLRSKEGAERVRLGRDSYTYLHFPMVAGIIYLAVGLKKVAEYVADTSHHGLSDPLPAGAVWPMFGGVAVYLLAHLAFRLRNVGTINVPRAVTAALLLLLPLVAVDLPALGALALLAGVVVGLTVVEAVVYREARDRVRHGSS